MKIKLLVFVVLLAAVMLAGCADTKNTSTGNITPENATPVGYAKVVDVFIQDYAFHPEVVTISHGDSVRWINNDSVAYIVGSSGTFESPTLTKGKTFTFTFSKSGTYNYYLLTHPYTKGGFVVVD